MQSILILTPLLVVAAVLLPLGSWTRRYFESSLWPTIMDEDR